MRPRRPSYLTPEGYVFVYAPEHRRASAKGYVREHLIVAEDALGKPIPDGAEVHHVNEDKSDSRRGNLVICEDRTYHVLLHRRRRAFLACGDASALKCEFCQGYDRQSEIVTSGSHAFHSDCRNASRRKRHSLGFNA